MFAVLVITVILCTSNAIIAASQPGFSPPPPPDAKMGYITKPPEQYEEMMILLDPNQTQGRYVWAVPVSGPSRTNDTEFTILYSTDVTDVGQFIERGKSTVNRASVPVNSMMVIGIYGGALLLLIILYGSGRRFSAGYQANTGRWAARIFIILYLGLAGLLLLSSFILTDSALGAY